MIISAEELKNKIQINNEIKTKVKKDQDTINNIILWKDKRKLIIAWPCSMDFKESLIEYWKKLRQLQEKYDDKVFIVMRAYDSKPRTTVWRKWIIQWWEFWSEVDRNKWIEKSREIIKELVENWLAIANELLYPQLLEHLDDLVSYIAIWARNSEYQQHREIASSVNKAVWMKNPTSWDSKVSANNLIAARSSQSIFPIWNLEQNSRWNPYSHIILRWANIEWKSINNINDEFIDKINKNLEESWLQTNYIIDLNHDNSWKNAELQNENLKKSLSLKNKDKIVWYMIESYIYTWNQKWDPKNLWSIKKWMSLTDPCIDLNKLEDTIKLIN